MQRCSQSCRLLLSDEGVVSAVTDKAKFDRSSSAMKIPKIAMLIVAIAVALYILLPNLSWAEDADALSGVQSTLHSPFIRQPGSVR